MEIKHKDMERIMNKEKKSSYNFFLCLEEAKNYF